MIIIRLTGVLGNQMFQYAVARRTAHINNTKLKPDILSFSKSNFNNSRHYSLGVFNIIENFASKEEIVKLKKNRLSKTIRKK